MRADPEPNVVRKPGRSLPQRQKWERWHVITAVSLLSLTAGIVAIGQGGQSAGNSTTTGAEPAIARAQGCAAAGVERDTQLSRDTILRDAPSAKASPIINPTEADSTRDAESWASVTADVPLRTQCVEGEWSRVRVLATGLRWMEGWVPSTALRKLKTGADGRRTLTVSDIEWQPGSVSDKAAIVKVANLILRNDKRCEAIDNRSLLVEGSKRKRLYTLTCDGPAGSFEISFKPGDAQTRSFGMAAVDPNAPELVVISKSDAASACMDALRERLHQPRSVDFHAFSDTTFSSEGARARFTIGFTAKNGLGLDIDNVGACTFEGANLASVEILPPGS